MNGTRVPGPDSILIGVVKNPALRPLQGQTLAAIAKARGKEPIDTLLDILVEDNGYTGCAVFGMQEDDVALALVQPWVSVNNDSSGTSPKDYWARSTRIRAPTAPFPEFCTSTCARSIVCRWRRRSASSPRYRRSACGSPIAAC